MGSLFGRIYAIFFEFTDYSGVVDTEALRHFAGGPAPRSDNFQIFSLFSLHILVQRKDFCVVAGENANIRTSLGVLKI